MRRRNVFARQPKEDDVQGAVVDWMRVVYHREDLLVTWNYLQGVKLPMAIASRAKRLGSRRGLPDMLLFEPTSAHIGLALELKRDGEHIATLENTWYGGEEGHVAEQAKTLEAFGDRGWYATFALGYDHATTIIKAYLDGRLSHQDSPFGVVAGMRPNDRLMAMCMALWSCGMAPHRVLDTIRLPERYADTFKKHVGL